MSDVKVRSVTIGTAGHIDHGKTTLVRRLVGGAQTVDRLKDEQRRGMTIDIGYAEFVLMDETEVGIVDVPGHERFIRNMVAGASGIDIVVLVVAADDGVMPQTREHLDIMTLLGIRTGVVAITKCDLVDEEMLELARDDVQTFLQGTFLEGAPIHDVSGETGDGIEALSATLQVLVSNVPPRSHEGLFRLPVQRTFTVPGFGTVVTGIPLDGTVSVGDRLEILPRRLKTRVRGLQAYHHTVETAHAGHRTALNLADVDYRAVRRGDVLCTPGLVHPSSMLAVRVRLLPTAPKPLASGTKVRVHVGTSVVDGKLHPLESRSIRPGTEAFAQIRTDHPVVVGPGDRFVLRRPSPALTLGGGQILGLPAMRLKARRTSTIRALEERERGLGDPDLAVEALLRGRHLDAASPEDVSRELLVWPEAAGKRLEALEAAGRAVRPGPAARWYHPEAFGKAREGVRGALEKLHARSRLKEWVDLTEVRTAARLPAETFEAAFRALETDGEVVRDASGAVRLASHAVNLSPQQAERLEALETALRDGGFSPPVEGELPRLAEALPEECRALVELLVQRGRAVRVSDSLLFHADALEAARERIAAHEKAETGMTAAEIRSHLETSRKYVIPLLEHLDASGFTVRRGDLRVVSGR
jgi:selenocysteine-specific elongation factor